MNHKPCFPGSETLLLGASPQRCANRGLICWLVVLPYLMGARMPVNELCSGCRIRDSRRSQRSTKSASVKRVRTGTRIICPRCEGQKYDKQHCGVCGNRGYLPSTDEVGQSSRPIPSFAGRKDTLNPVTGVFTAGVQSVQVCQAMLLRRIFLLCPESCLKLSQNTT